jgi:thiamine biosynthesis lipoprotein
VIPGKPSGDHHVFSFFAMGTECRLYLCGDVEAATRAAGAAAEEVGRLEARYSRYRADSWLSDINRVAARGGTVAVDEETAGLLDYAFACYRKSFGRFDITSGPLRRCWDFNAARLPETGAIAGLLPLIGMDKLDWAPPLLTFRVAGMEIDLGGVVKEYAADRAAERCAALGIDGGLVELGGDIRVVGPRPGGGWEIGIRHPRDRGAVMAIIVLSGGGLASSGDYERFFELDGRRYCHLLDPVTGWPVEGLSAVTVTAESCLVAGSVASMAMLKGREGASWLARTGLDHVWMDERGRQGGNLSPPVG